MQVEKDRVVQFHYEIFDADGKRVETSREHVPVVALYGYGNLVPGVEQALAGRTAGDRFEVRVSPENGYGERREGQVRRVQKKHLENSKQLRPGQTVVLRSQQGAVHGTVTKVGRTVVDVDLNHPYAGLTLAFRIEVLEVREAEAEEITHGHAHGPGGHAHG